MVYIWLNRSMSVIAWVADTSELKSKVTIEK